MKADRSFTEYIASRFDNEIFNAIADYINEKVAADEFDDLELRIFNVHQVGSVELDEAKVLHVDVYDLPEMKIGFDIRVEASIIVQEGDYHYDEEDNPSQWFVLRCTGDLSKNLDDFEIHGEPEIYRQKDSYKKKLSDSLVPMIRSNDYEKAAEDFLRQYYPEALNTVCYVDPMTIAKKMHLQVIQRSISSDCSIFGQCYFRDCDTTLYNEQTDQDEQVHIDAGTILVDPNTFFMYNIGRVNNTIIHECVHWAFHRKAFELDRLCNQAESMIGCKVIGGIKDRNSGAVGHMERQANAITPRIQMPRRVFKYLAEQYLYEANKELDYEGSDIDVIEKVIDELADAFGVSRLAAKIRMVELGYEVAVGAFNWVDGHYVPTFKFKKGSLKRNQTFCIGALDAAVLLASNVGPFQKIISDGGYQYIDCHFVINSPKYVQTDANGFSHLTRYARTHMDECCLAFDMEVKGYAKEYLTLCYLDRDENSKIATTISYGQGLENSKPEVQKKALETYLKSARDVYMTFTNSWSDCLHKAYEWQKKIRGGLTYKELAENITMDADTVSRIINGKHNPTKASLARICLGLQLPDFMSKDIFSKAPCGQLSFANTDEFWIYMALNSMYGQSMASINKFLGDHGVYL